MGSAVDVEFESPERTVTMKTRWIVLLVVIFVSVWGCGETEDSAAPVGGTKPVEAGSDGEENRPARAKEKVKALVQVLISGLAVVQLENSIEPPYGVFFLEKGEHSLRLSQGQIADQNFSWTTVEDNFAGKKIRLLGGNPLKLHEVYEDMPLRGLPESSKADPDAQLAEIRARASDHRWVLNAETLGGSDTEFFLNKAPGAWLLLDSYQLETCALTLDRALVEACMVRSAQPGNKFLAKGAAEALVLRGEVTVDKDDLSLNLFSIVDEDEPVSIKGIDLGDCSAGAPCVIWNDIEYQYVFDAHLDNGPEATGTKSPRKLSSIHGKHLKTVFAKMKFADWEVYTPGCSVDEPDPSDLAKCDEMCADVQPTCWSHFRQYFRPSDKGGAEDYKSTLDVAMCPLVQYP